MHSFNLKCLTKFYPKTLYQWKFIKMSMFKLQAIYDDEFFDIAMINVSIICF